MYLLRCTKTRSEAGPFLFGLKKERRKKFGEENERACHRSNLENGEEIMKLFTVRTSRTPPYLDGNY